MTVAKYYDKEITTLLSWIPLQHEIAKFKVSIRHAAIIDYSYGDKVVKIHGTRKHIAKLATLIC